MRIRQWNTSKIIWNIKQVNGEHLFSHLIFHPNTGFLRLIFISALYLNTNCVFLCIFSCRSKKFQCRASPFIPKSCFFPPLASAEQPGAGCNARDTDGLRGHAAAHGPLEMKMKWGSVVCSTLIRFWPPFQCDPIGLNCFISQPAKSKWVVDVIWLFTGNHPWLIYLLLLCSVRAQYVAGAHKLQRKNLSWLCIVYICCHPIRGEAFMKY